MGKHRITSIDDETVEYGHDERHETHEYCGGIQSSGDGEKHDHNGHTELEHLHTELGTSEDVFGSTTEMADVHQWREHQHAEARIQREANCNENWCDHPHPARNDGMAASEYELYEGILGV